MIDKNFVTRFITKHRKKDIAVRKITYFEVCTALSFAWFEHKKVDIAVIETGLGGRLDATNTIRPLLSIITDISYDHMHILGNTLKKIAHEKAGIIKEGIPVLTGILPPSAAQEVARTSHLKRAALHKLIPGKFYSNRT